VKAKAVAKAVAKPAPSAVKAKPLAKPAPAVAKPKAAALKPVAHKDSSAPASRAAPPPSSGDLRNFARQSQVISAPQASNYGNAGTEKCVKCGDKFDGEYVVAQGKSFHLHHFTCSDCGSKLGTSFYDHKGSQLCTNCAGKLLPCYKCGRGITGQYIIQDGKPHHKECLDHWVCAKCRQNVEDVVTNALGKHWHKHCFTCHSCGTALGGTFVAKDGNPFCQNCSQKSLAKCLKCNRELVGDYVNYDNKAFHNECFRCGKCNTQLQLSGFYNVGGQTVCERCAR